MTDAFEDEAEQTMTIGEYIEGVEAEELKADLVLGGDEGKDCTYSKGYMKRQAIFSCLTCVPDGNAGICTACSLSCHDGHEVVELWTKRRFKCDCGNSKFGVFVCKLWPNKDPENGENSYNQNFKGSYCTCGRPYPDPDSQEQTEMIQCCICEDWFHENHLGLDSLEQIPRDEEGEPLYDEFICQECAASCCFLKLYPISILASSKQKVAPIHADSGTVSSEKDGENAKKKEPDMEKDNACSRNQSSSSMCILGIDINSTSVVFEKKEPMFLSKIWRDLLCRCSTCWDYYTQKGIGYLIDKEDSLEEYEKMGKQKREEKLQQQEGAELNFLNTLNHVQKMEILNGISDMKNEFRSFLESVDTSKPITPDDVRGIFENLVKKKKQRLL
ncbi:putative E3 ubiquitin-protein ligase UBR7 [Phoenix dactylifera]|uniref:E3 ubiquitin-protein ligase UBR7 n=1 Tax=Phoenix dactylifera TaxID=42345 RepID=A0A8B8ZH10_PHODC|nr:putative E3 ubiquitin-protein ligase UBR7 [Phoenix dactylifera]